MAVDFNPAISQSINRNLNRATEQVSSGRRINSASDDAAGLGVAVNINSQVRSQESAISNAINGISLIQTAQGGLRQVSDGLQQLREISIQANNGILNNSDRSSLQDQANQILAGIQDSLANTRFNDQKPLAQERAIDLQVGASASDRFAVPSRDVGSALDSFGLNAIDLTDSSNFESTIEALDQSLSFIETTAAEFGASQNRLDNTLNGLEVSNLRQTESASRIEDADLAQAISELIRNQLLQRSLFSLQAQANAQRGQVLSLLNA